MNSGRSPLAEVLERTLLVLVIVLVALLAMAPLMRVVAGAWSQIVSLFGG